VAVRVFQLAVAVAPEHVLQRHGDGSAGLGGAFEPAAGVIDFEVKRDAGGRRRGRAAVEFSEIVREQHRHAIDAQPRVHDAQVLLEHHMPARAENLREMRNALRKTLDHLGVEPALRDRLVLAVDEACANIIRHAYGSEREGGIGLVVSRAEDVLSFELTDDAPCIDPDKVRPKPLGECRPGGLGVALIDTVMDTWHIEPAPGRSGNRLVLRKRIEDRTV